MRLFITSYLPISLKDLSLDVFSPAHSLSFNFQGNSLSLWGHHPHLIDEEAEAWVRKGLSCVNRATANKWLSRDQNPHFFGSSLQVVLMEHGSKSQGFLLGYPEVSFGDNVVST